MRLKLQTDFLLYTVSLAEYSEGNYIKLATLNSKHDHSVFLFGLTTGKLEFSHIDCEVQANRDIYESLSKQKGITLSEFLAKCMDSETMISYSQAEAKETFAEKPPVT